MKFCFGFLGEKNERNCAIREGTACAAKRDLQVGQFELLLLRRTSKFSFVLVFRLDFPKTKAINDSFQILCTHDGVLLRNASAEYILDQEMGGISGSLSLMELQSSKRMFFEWKPNDSTVVVDDDYYDDHDQEWSIVDKIQKRPRTTSECRIFKCEMPASPPPKPKCIRVDIEHLRSLELTSKGHCVRFKRRNGELHSEYFFQHGNADIFIKALQSFHIIEGIQGNRSEYVIINTEPKLMKTFAMLELDEIKNTPVNVSRIFSNPIADFLTKVGSGASRLSPVSRRTSPTEYEDLGEQNHKIEESEKENGEKMEKDVEECKDTKRTVVLPEKRIVTRGESFFNYLIKFGVSFRNGD